MAVQVYTSDEVDALIGSSSSCGCSYSTSTGSSNQQIFYDDQAVVSLMGINPSGGNLWYTLYRKRVDGVSSGDKFIITAEANIRNDTSWTVEVANILSVKSQESAPGDYDYYNANEIDPGMIGAINGFNVTPQTHYFDVKKSFVYEADQNHDFLWFQLRSRATSSSSNGSQNVTVQNQSLIGPQGFIQVLKL